ncbi:hypothetical protein A2348_01515 [Candidatus Uhrbacteria bacterium RIFOXYB12_FULL_58_10]|uniref:nicotinamidase n=1 Tax=Candidatus Uhrbacteria bacterium RIFOXYB2_FULL_57_15 TaxID=1802422 RepID=A0A1F7W5J5_9BACT|nr:MAG: hypothetical protein A2348_01515 [Candidatus Uhrbacteria bacterium RIFOXYB12_FULL_58_10]OGL98061.1 MAG: hypothetical protein A2304_00945 [Candidatus Uhrbacteria bacterium RIFOXYB2_FULL_57_15]OGL99739.1 MAG: hypothetical protein A2501_00285 [Candidatus Uhrbacteria bacterium RIFOXYC12_FULL_57_11]
MAVFCTRRTLEGLIVPRIGTWAFLGIDLQSTFCKPYPLGVDGCNEQFGHILRLMRKFPVNRRIVTRDIHPWGHVSLASSFIGYAKFHDLTLSEVLAWTENRIAAHALFTLAELIEYLTIVGFQTLWPDHAIEGEDDARIYADIERESTITWNKGNRPHRDSYSAFRDNGGDSTRLDEYERCRGITTNVVTGFVFDVCDGLSGLHSLEYGFETYMVTDLSPAITQEGADEMADKIKAAGGHLITSDQIRAAA